MYQIPYTAGHRCRNLCGSLPDLTSSSCWKSPPTSPCLHQRLTHLCLCTPDSQPHRCHSICPSICPIIYSTDVHPCWRTGTAGLQWVVGSQVSPCSSLPGPPPLIGSDPSHPLPLPSCTLCLHQASRSFLSTPWILYRMSPILLYPRMTFSSFPWITNSSSYLLTKARSQPLREACQRQNSSSESPVELCSCDRHPSTNRLLSSASRQNLGDRWWVGVSYLFNLFLKFTAPPTITTRHQIYANQFFSSPISWI